MRNLITDFQNSDTQEIKLTISSNFISSKDAEEEHVMYSKSENIKFKFYNDANKVVDEVFESLRSRYQGNLKTSMRGSNFVFDSVLLTYYKCHNINFKCGGWFIYWFTRVDKKEKSNNKSEKCRQ